MDYLSNTSDHLFSSNTLAVTRPYVQRLLLFRDTPELQRDEESLKLSMSDFELIGKAKQNPDSSFDQISSRENSMTV